VPKQTLGFGGSNFWFSKHLIFLHHHSHHSITTNVVDHLGLLLMGGFRFKDNQSRRGRDKKELRFLFVQDSLLPYFLRRPTVPKEVQLGMATGRVGDGGIVPVPGPVPAHISAPIPAPFPVAGNKFPPSPSPMGINPRRVPNGDFYPSFFSSFIILTLLFSS